METITVISNWISWLLNTIKQPVQPKTNIISNVPSTTEQRPAPKYRNTLIKVINRKEIPVEWEIVKTIYRDESWSKCFNCFNIGGFFVYTNPLEKTSRRALERLESYLDSYGHELMSELDQWGEIRSFELVAEMFSTHNFDKCRYRTDIVHYRGRSYLVHLFTMNEHIHRWIDESGNSVLDDKLSNTVVVYVRSLDSSSIAGLQRNIALTEELFRPTGEGSVNIWSGWKWLGQIAKFTEPQLTSKDEIPQIESDLSKDGKLPVRTVECWSMKYNRTRKLLTRSLLSIGKVWGRRPCKAESDWDRPRAS